MPQQQLGPGLPDAGHPGQGSAHASLSPLLPVEGDGIAVDLLLDGGYQGEGGALGVDGDLPAVQGNGPGAVMAVLDHAEDRNGIAVAVHHRLDRRDMPLAAVQQNQVRQGAEAVVLPFVGLAAGLLSQSLIPAGYLCSAAAALPAYLLTGIFHCIVLWAQGHPAWGAAMSVTLRELCVSLLWSLPMTWLFRRVYLRVHVDD